MNEWVQCIGGFSKCGCAYMFELNLLLNNFANIHSNDNDNNCTVERV